MKWPVPRKKTRKVFIGSVPMGGDEPLRLQSMTTANTLNTKAIVDETIRLCEAGCEIVRITAPSPSHARNLSQIKKSLKEKGLSPPLVADIHFSPRAAMEAAEHVDKVRINPGNYADRKRFEKQEYTDAEYKEELKRIEENFHPLLFRLKEKQIALRIGTNHGSLSDRIMNRYGDTPAGMVESALEYLRIAVKNDYFDIVLSMKASRPSLMLETYRSLSRAMEKAGYDFPIHLGVTEAGDGEDGRIKSAIGIGGMLEEGVGDTIRVSLTEDPEREIPVARAIASLYEGRTEGESDLLSWRQIYSPRRVTEEREIGGQKVILVFDEKKNNSPKEDKVFLPHRVSLSKLKSSPELLERLKTSPPSYLLVEIPAEDLPLRKNEKARKILSTLSRKSIIGLDI